MRLQTLFLIFLSGFVKGKARWMISIQMTWFRYPLATPN